MFENYDQKKLEKKFTLKMSAIHLLAIVSVLDLHYIMMNNPGELFEAEKSDKVRKILDIILPEMKDILKSEFNDAKTD